MLSQAQQLSYKPERLWRYQLTIAQGTGDCGMPGGRRYRYLVHALNAERFDIALVSVLTETTRVLSGTQ